MQPTGTFIYLRLMYKSNFDEFIHDHEHPILSQGMEEHFKNQPSIWEPYMFRVGFKSFQNSSTMKQMILES